MYSPSEARHKQAVKHNEAQQVYKHKHTMVVILAAAAAITAAGVGAYHGGKLAVEDVGKKIRRRKTARARQAERSDEEAMKSRARQMDDSRKKNMSVSDRVERFKKGIPGGANRGGLTRKSQL